MANNILFEIFFSFSGIFDPDDATKKIGIIPDSSNCMGETSRLILNKGKVIKKITAHPLKYARWKIWNFGVTNSENIHLFIEELTNRLYPRKRQLDEFIMAHNIIKRNISVNIYDEHKSGEVIINSNYLSKFAELCKDINIRCWCEFDHGNEKNEQQEPKLSAQFDQYCFDCVNPWGNTDGFYEDINRVIIKKDAALCVNEFKMFLTYDYFGGFTLPAHISKIIGDATTFFLLDYECILSHHLIE